MADVTFRIPSKAVTYGYIEVLVPASPEATPEMLAARYVNYVYAFQKEEQAALKRLQEGTGAPQGASQEAEAAIHQEAVDRLSAGLSATAVNEYNDDGPGDVQAAANEARKYKVGDTVTVAGIEFTKHSDAPWDSTVAPKRKPWETGEAAPRAVDLGDDW